jgi:hypothetical protein
MIQLPLKNETEITLGIHKINIFQFTSYNKNDNRYY